MDKNLIVIGIMIWMLIILGFIIKPAEVNIGFIAVLGIIAFLGTFINLKVGILLLIFMVPLSVQFNLGKVGLGAIDIASDDILVLSIITGWLGYLALTKQRIYSKSPLNMPFIGFFIVSLLSLIPVSIYLNQQALLICLLRVLKWFEYIIIYYVIISVIKNKKELKVYTFIFLTTSLVIALSQIAIVQFGKTSDKYLYGKSAFSYAVPFGFESNGILAAYYLLFLSIMVALTLKYLKGGYRLFWGGASILLTYALLTTFSRASYLGAAVSMLILGLVLDKRILFFLLLGAIILPIFLPTAYERVTMTAVVKNDKIEFEESAKSRLDLWTVTLDQIINNPSPLFGSGFWSTRYRKEFSYNTPHNQFLAVLYETGIMGFAFFFLIFYRVIRLAFFNFRTSNDSFIKVMNIGFLAGVSGILVQSFFAETFESVRVTGPLWFMTAMVVLSSLFLKTEGAKQADELS